MKTIGHSIRDTRTNFLCWIIAIIILLQNGPLNNLPIILLVLMLPTLRGFTFRKIGKCEKLVLFYGIYLLGITLINIGNNFDLKYTSNILIQYVIIYVSLKFSLVKINFEKLLFFLRNFGLIISVFCLVEAITNRHIWALLLGKTLADDSARVVGVFNHPIICACYLLITLILTIFFPLSKKRNQIIALFGITSAILLTQSRSIWIAMFLVVVIYLFKFHRRKINKMYLLYVLGIIGIIFPVSLALQYNVIGKIVSFVNSRIKGSLQAGEGHIVRIEIILNSLQYWKEHSMGALFGQGKNYGLLYLKYNPIKKFGTFIWDAAIDNQYITLIYETGVMGLGLISFIVVIAFNRFVKATSTDKIQMAVSLCLIGNAICLFFFEGLNYPVMVLLYMVFILLSDMQKSYTSDKNLRLSEMGRR